MKDYARKYNMSLGEYIEANSLNMRVSEYLVELHKMYMNEIYKK
ncbi:hypothetical protein N4239_11650 [Brachyspira hyodysenteriae]|nr:hypothetical protein [Brachyspira hyodysenteriae]WPC23587.1 hypothetical protein N4239_11650 [Brachyspira hyodysenteriae]